MKKWCEARSINPQLLTLCLIAAMAQTRLHVCAGSSDHYLLFNGISTNISDIMNTLILTNDTIKKTKGRILNASVRTIMPSSDKVMQHFQMH